ncbi:MAG: ABC transporter ATP-binding protein [Chloroflexota bacterium]
MSGMSLAKVEIRDLRRSFRRPDGNEQVALAGVNLAVAAGSFTSIVGPSGCGKSTLLSIIAGLVEPSGGDVRIDGQAVRGVQRGIGFLFQHDTLLPWWSVRDNVGFGLRLQRFPAVAIKARVAEWIGRVGLTGFEQHYPAQLSGGMRKRVALAQMLAFEPDLILMDEPFAALDAQTRNLMENDLLRIVEQSGQKTVLFVTHDLEEAVALSDRTVLMTAGPAATVKASYEVPLARPRDVMASRQNPQFRTIFTAIWQGLSEEVDKSFGRADEYEI